MNISYNIPLCLLLRSRYYSQDYLDSAQPDLPEYLFFHEATGIGPLQSLGRTEIEG